MCGIFAAAANSAISESLVGKAVGTLAHRGPDGEGIWVHSDRRAALGHRRLSVIAPEDGLQPLVSEDGRVRAVVNGEFYGFEQTRRELSQTGHRFATQSDSEVAVHLYEDLGLDFVTRLRGEFALAIWDESRRQLVAARDRFGVKPLLYATTSNGTLIASEAKALFAAGIERRWDFESFHQAASMQYVLPDRTLFAGIRQVPPGCLLIVSHDREPRIERYWEPPLSRRDPPEDGRQSSPIELIERCRGFVVDAVRTRLRADARVCVQLSGGLDSSAVLGIAAAETTEPIDAYSIVFDNADYDERDSAIQAAAHAGARLHTLTVSPAEILSSLCDAVCMSEGLCINGHLAAKFLLSRQMQHDGFKVVLTGEGADEAFAGYAHLRTDHWRTTGADHLIRQLDRTNRSSLGMMMPHGESLDLRGVERRLGYVPAWMEAKGTFGRRVHSLLRDDFVDEFRDRDPFGEFVDSVVSDARRDFSPVECSTLLWTQSALASYILATLGDGTEMAHSIEGRVPFLDHHLWEFLRDVPVELKIHGTTEKHILREAIRDFVPDSIYRREKHPFDAPPVTLGNEDSTREFLHDTLRSEAFRSQPFFDVDRTRTQVEQLATADETTKLAWDPVIMTVLSTTLLQQRLLTA